MYVRRFAAVTCEAPNLHLAVRVQVTVRALGPTKTIFDNPIVNCVAKSALHRLRGHMGGYGSECLEAL